MASSYNFSSIVRNSKKGVTQTNLSKVDSKTEVAPNLSIGAVDDYEQDIGLHEADEPTYKSSSNCFANLIKNSEKAIVPKIETQVELSKTEPKAEPKKESIFADLVKSGKSEQLVRNDIHAIKIITKLIQGISFNPGAAAPNLVKSEVLKNQILQVHHLASRVASAAAPAESQSPWILAQCSESIAEMISTCSERSKRSSDNYAENQQQIENQIQAVCDIMQYANTDSELGQTLDSLSFNRYIVADNQNVAHDRLMVSTSAAAWDIYNRVENSEYLYGRKAVDITQILADGLVKKCGEVNSLVANQDMVIAHLQGSIRRLANLIGAEYVSKARDVNNWIHEDVTDVNRAIQANNYFLSKFIPEILKNAYNNFIAIEKLAPKLLQDANLEVVNNQNKDRLSEK